MLHHNIKQKYIVDCDPGLDDARSLLFLLSDPEVEVIAVTIVAGNVISTLGAVNAGMTLHAIHRSDIPIYQCEPANLSGETVVGDSYFGPTGFGHLQLEHSSIDVRSDMSSHQALVHYATKYPNEITLTCVGPLTNLAKAFKINDSITRLFKSIYVMGGDRSEKTTYNVTEYAEFNFYADPFAAQMVLKNFGHHKSSPFYLFDWTLCLKYPIKIGFYQEIGSILAEQGKESISQIIKEIPAGVDLGSAPDVNNIEMFVADEFPIVVSYKTNIITKTSSVICRSVERTGERKGHSTFKNSQDGNIILIDELDFDKFKSTFKKNFTGEKKITGV